MSGELDDIDSIVTATKDAVRYAENLRKKMEDPWRKIKHLEKEKAYQCQRANNEALAHVKLTDGLRDLLGHERADDATLLARVGELVRANGELAKRNADLNAANIKIRQLWLDEMDKLASESKLYDSLVERLSSLLGCEKTDRDIVEYVNQNADKYCHTISTIADELTCQPKLSAILRSIEELKTNGK